jgi:hypothetical protein
MVDLPFSQFLQNVGGTVGGDDLFKLLNTGGLKTVALSPSESVVMGNPVVDTNKEVLQ